MSSTDYFGFRWRMSWVFISLPDSSAGWQEYKAVFYSGGVGRAINSQESWLFSPPPPPQHRCIFYEVKNAEPTIQDRRQTRLLGWQQRVPRLHSGGLEQNSLGQLILLKQRPHLADRAVIFQPSGSCGASRGFSKGRRREIWAAVHNCGLGSLSWISEGLIILVWEVKWHWGVERVNRGSRQSVHQSCFGAFRHITAGTNGDQGLERDHMTHRSQYRLVSLTALHHCSTKGKIQTEKSVWNEALITKPYNNLHRL